MTTHATVFGIPMQRRSKRRQLVIVTYSVLGALWLLCTLLPWSGSDLWPWALYATLAAGMFVLGGQGRYGLVKPFLNKPPRQTEATAPVVRLGLEDRPLSTADESSWRNDERELQVRDQAHYQAYQPITVLLLVVLLLSAFSLHGSRWLSPQAVHRALFSISLAATMLALTLPAALILWREPDLDL